MRLLILSTAVVMLSACGGSSSSDIAPQDQVGSLPETITDPVANPSTPARIELGRMLFWDPVLSGNQDVACATCHHPDNAYTDNLDISQGVGGVGLSAARTGGTLVQRNSQTLLNVVFNGHTATETASPEDAPMFWDNRVTSLERQALDPIRSESEMRGTLFSRAEILDVVVGRLQRIPEYEAMFAAAFGDPLVDASRIGDAIASFERSLTANNSRFDQFARGDENALTQEEIRGLTLFNDAGCNVCHSGPMFSDFELHQLPVANNDKLTEPDNGVEGRFRTPSLRNVALTAPYMHNGTIATLEGAIGFYDGIANPSNDPDLAQLDFDGDDDVNAAIAAFLATLTDEEFDRTVPESVPSGLNPGGNL